MSVVGPNPTSAAAEAMSAIGEFKLTSRANAIDVSK